MTTTQCSASSRAHFVARPAQARGQKRLLAISGIVVTPLVFAASLLLTLPVGIVNATIIAVVPALFAAGYFGGLYLLARAIERDERVGTVPASDPTSQRQWRAA